MEQVHALQEGQSLCLLAPFNPIPLVQHLARAGFTHKGTVDNHGTWRVVFFPQGSANHVIAADWPEPSVFLDFTDSDASSAATELVTILRAHTQDTGGDAVVFALLAHPPEELVNEQTLYDFSYYVQWDEVAGAYAVLFRKAKGQDSMSPTIEENSPGRAARSAKL